VVSRVQYVMPSPPVTTLPNTFPQIFNNSNVSGIQGNIFLDYFTTKPGGPLLNTLALTAVSVAQGHQNGQLQQVGDAKVGTPLPP
jgi:hypothetical protein